MPNEKVEAAIRKILNVKVSLNKGDIVFILTDRGMGSLGFTFFKIAFELGARPSICDMEPLAAEGDEPLAQVVTGLRKAKIAILLTSKSLAGTIALSNAKKAGVSVFDFSKFTEAQIIELGDSLG